ncbi:hypothetical protein FRC06_000085 [Ceratobasidium sp. 370]|nr:hypothetical protein FRC06_000085 [Ceratobasidium sp. 370]
MGEMETTITRQGQTVAVIQWKVFARSTLTMGGETKFVKEVFPKTKALSTHLLKMLVPDRAYTLQLTASN